VTSKPHLLNSNNVTEITLAVKLLPAVNHSVQQLQLASGLASVRPLLATISTHSCSLHLSPPSVSSPQRLSLGQQRVHQEYTLRQLRWAGTTLGFLTPPITTITTIMISRCRSSRTRLPVPHYQLHFINCTSCVAYIHITIDLDFYPQC
jgi:hypothetical protein